MPSIPTAALPVTEFAAFKAFVVAALPAVVVAVGAPPWTFTDATAAALSVAHALGHPAIFDETPAEQGERALAWYLARYGSPEWLRDSEDLVRTPSGGADAVTFALDDPNPLRGYDEAAWAPDRATIRRLNSWCGIALDAFRRAQRSGDPSAERPTLRVKNERTDTAPSPGLAGDSPATGFDKPMIQGSLQKRYDDRVRASDPAPTIIDDRSWAEAQGITHDCVEELRRNCKDPRLPKRGPRGTRRRPN